MASVEEEFYLVPISSTHQSDLDQLQPMQTSKIYVVRMEPSQRNKARETVRKTAVMLEL